MKTKPYIIILLLFVTQLAAAQTEKRIALVIGNNAYPGKALTNPVNDAKLMDNTLQELGFQVTLLLDASKETMNQAFRDFAENIESAKVTFIFFAGHGMQIDGVNYLMPVDADPQKPEDVAWEAIDIENILNRLEFYPENLNIVVLDACRNNPFRSWGRGDVPGFSEMKPEGTIIGYATCEGCTADDNPTGNNGLYTSKLVEEMKKPQEITKVFKNTRNAVKEASNSLQKPAVYDQTSGDFYLVKPSPSDKNQTNISGFKSSDGSTMESPESLSRTEYSLSKDAIVHFRVVEIQGRKLTIEIDYQYNSKHGEKVMVGAWLKGVSSGYLPAYVPTKNEGTARIQITVNEPGTSTDVDIFLYEWGRPAEQFARRVFPYQMRFE